MTICSGFDKYENIYKRKQWNVLIRNISYLLGVSPPGKQIIQDLEKLAEIQLPGL